MPKKGMDLAMGKSKEVLAEMSVTPDLIVKTKLLVAVLDELGREINNPEPAYIAAGPKPLTITEQIQRLLRVELSRQAEEQGFESWEESDDMDFDEDEGDAPQSPYQDERVMRPDHPKKAKPDLGDLDIEMHDDVRDGQGGQAAGEGGGTPEIPPPEPPAKGKKGQSKQSASDKT